MAQLLWLLNLYRRSAVSFSWFDAKRGDRNKEVECSLVSLQSLVRMMDLYTTGYTVCKIYDQSDRFTWSNVPKSVHPNFCIY